MKKTFTIILLVLFVSTFSYAQNKQYVAIIEAFQQAYTQDDYKPFYDLFSPELKQNISFENTSLFYQDMKKKLGTIKEVSFYGLDKEGYELYETTFENGVTLLLNLSVSDAGKLLGFRVVEAEDYEEAKTSYLQESYEDLLDQAALALPNKGQFAIALIDGDEVEYIGMKKNGNAVQVIENKHTVFSIGNFSTLFTATLLTKAINSNLIGMSDLVNTYYPFEFKDSIKLSFASLADHASFLPILPPLPIESVELKEQDAYYFNYATSDLLRDLEHTIAIDSVNLERRSRFSYLGYALLGETLSRVYDKDFTELIKEHIFVPYNMKSTSLVQNSRKKAITGIDMDGITVKPSNFNLLRSSTGGFSTIEDLVSFIQANFNKEDRDLQLLQKPTLMIGPNFWSSLGWRISNPTDKKSAIYFSKGIDVGYCNYIGFSPEQKKGVVLLTNSSTSGTLDAIDDLAYKVMNKLLDVK